MLLLVIFAFGSSHLTAQFGFATDGLGISRLAHATNPGSFARDCHIQ